MSSIYNNIQERMTTTIYRKRLTEYYFAFRTKKNRDTLFSKWKVVYSPFVQTGSKNTGLYGDFLSSSWFKISMPCACECAIIKIVIPEITKGGEYKSNAIILSDIIDKMNSDKTFIASNFIEMFYSVDTTYLEDMTNRLNRQLIKENSEYATIHSTLNHEKGTIGFSFSLRKGDELACVYCPNFKLYPSSNKSVN